MFTTPQQLPRGGGGGGGMCLVERRSEKHVFLLTLAVSFQPVKHTHIQILGFFPFLPSGSFVSAHPHGGRARGGERDKNVCNSADLNFSVCNSQRKREGKKKMRVPLCTTRLFRPQWGGYLALGLTRISYLDDEKLFSLLTHPTYQDSITFFFLYFIFSLTGTKETWELSSMVEDPLH